MDALWSEDDRSSVLGRATRGDKVMPHSQKSECTCPKVGETIMDEILINCSILGQDVGRVFGVRILKSTLVHELKKAIKKEKEPELDHIAADKLDLWQVSDSAQRTYHYSTDV